MLSYAAETTTVCSAHCAELSCTWGTVSAQLAGTVPCAVSVQSELQLMLPVLLSDRSLSKLREVKSAYYWVPAAKRKAETLEHTMLLAPMHHSLLYMSWAHWARRTYISASAFWVRKKKTLWGYTLHAHFTVCSWTWAISFDCVKWTDNISQGFLTASLFMNM